MNKLEPIPTISLNYEGTGYSSKSNELGMRPMQEKAFAKRGEKYLLIKSPPASGKSRALMFITLDKIKNQSIKKAIIVVPERSIGASFYDTPLSKNGFFTDWKVLPKWNLCNSPGTEGGKVNSFKAFFESSDDILITTHSTFRFAVDKFGIDIFDNNLIAIDEFHHVSANPDNKLGNHLKRIIERNKADIIAMTGSYFRGDAEPVLMPEDEEKFENVTFTYYEQLNGYEFLKKLDIGYFFYSGIYSESILKVLNPEEKTIIHIPSVNSRESTKDKIQEVEHIIEELGEWQGTDPKTGFQLIKRPNGKIMKIADLVDDDAKKRDHIISSLKDDKQKHNRDHVDIIIALGMAKEGFDWVWCEHALTIGYRSSLTEIVQIIGRATRDAPGKTRARFTNLIAEPDASEELVTEAVNDTLKAISASLLMEQVLAPNFNFKSKANNKSPEKGFEYGEKGYDPAKENVGFNKSTGQIEIEVNGLKELKTNEAKNVCKNDINELMAAFVQDTSNCERGLLDRGLVPEELTQVRMGKIINEKYPEIDVEDQEGIRQRVIAAMNIVQKAKEISNSNNSNSLESERDSNTAFVNSIRKFVTDVSELNIDLIDRINPFGEAYSILAKTINEETLKQIESIISSKKVSMSLEEARELTKRAIKFQEERDRLPLITASDPWEKRMAEGIAFLQRKELEKQND
tara:strand:+ start:818 stop:2881 length:2064 start_codon:yes stop_codon:yes gene_type:complete